MKNGRKTSYEEKKELYSMCDYFNVRHGRVRKKKVDDDDCEPNDKRIRIRNRIIEENHLRKEDATFHHWHVEIGVAVSFLWFNGRPEFTVSDLIEIYF